MRILITNDDGINAPGLAVLRAIAEELAGLITAQRNFQANAKAIDTATQISQTVINLRS